MNILLTMPKYNDQIKPGMGVRVTTKVDGSWVQEDGFVINNTGDTLTVIRYSASTERGFKVANFRAVDFMQGNFKLQMLGVADNG